MDFVKTNVRGGYYYSSCYITILINTIFPICKSVRQGYPVKVLITYTVITFTGRVISVVVLVMSTISLDLR